MATGWGGGGEAERLRFERLSETPVLYGVAGESDDDGDLDEDSEDKTDEEVLEALALADLGGEEISSVALEVDDLVDMLGVLPNRMVSLVFMEAFFVTLEASCGAVFRGACLPAVLSVFEARGGGGEELESLLEDVSSEEEDDADRGFWIVSCSSSASLSEIEADEELDDEAEFNAVSTAFGAGDALCGLRSPSLSSLLLSVLPLLLLLLFSLAGVVFFFAFFFPFSIDLGFEALLSSSSLLVSSK